MAFRENFGAIDRRHSIRMVGLSSASSTPRALSPLHMAVEAASPIHSRTTTRKSRRGVSAGRISDVDDIESNTLFAQKLISKTLVHLVFPGKPIAASMLTL